MSEQLTVQQQQPLTIKSFFQKDNVKKRFEEMLGARANQFIASVLQVAANNELLKKSDPMSIYNAALIAATLDLTINQNLGFAWIVPYKGQAQFQVGWKGYVQLAQRTGQYSAINVIDVYENQFESYNELTEELKGDFTKLGQGKIVGYAAYFSLINGFQKTSYWSIEKVKKHGMKYSKSFSHSSSPWSSDFDAMAKKTVLKNTLAKWGILSVEMQKATIADQAVINDADTIDVTYADNSDEPIQVDHEFERLMALIAEAETIEELEKYKPQDVDGELYFAYESRFAELSKAKKK